ncbi:MAG: hypothetical protein E6G50_08185 [Actinobacteria bacterium]|nr:MAG: hypothetical protein E6G50_08185 [Actinomycetota bacterium]
MDQGTSAFARSRPHIIARPRVTHQLSEATAGVLILTAPAGYGKTTVAREWLSQEGRMAIWCQITSASLDVAALSTAVALACRSAIPDAGAALIDRLRATRNALPEPEVLAETLARDLLEWPEVAWLVLDDYHTLLDSPPSERFVEDLFRRAKIRALILTRRRPSWLSARQLIHGEAHELGANVLAMTHGEACAVLDDEEGQRVSGLLALTQGWPAVIGLAALSGASVIDLEDLLPETLHTYFAEELYQCLDDDLKDALLDLSLAPTISNTVGFELFGPKGERLLLRCAESGFLTAFGPGVYELHPLLRQFLLTKVGHVDHDLEARVERIARLTQRHRRWDDASVLIEKFGADGIIDGFLEAAVDDLLRAGRSHLKSTWPKQNFSSEKQNREERKISR